MKIRESLFIIVVSIALLLVSNLTSNAASLSNIYASNEQTDTDKINYFADGTEETFSTTHKVTYSSNVNLNWYQRFKVSPNENMVASTQATIKYELTGVNYDYWYKFNYWEADTYVIPETDKTNNPLEFTMPDANVAFKAIVSPKIYFYADNGIINVKINGQQVYNGYEFEEYVDVGNLVEFDFTPDLGYELETWKLNGAGNNATTFTADELKQNKLTFIMSQGYLSFDSPEILRKSYEMDKEINPVDGGSIDITPVGDQYYNTPMTATATANPDFKFDHWEATGYDISELDKNSSTLNYLMPANDMTLKAVFVPLTYPISVNVNNLNYGLASADLAEASTGDTVTLTATANNGYKFKQWNVVSGEITISNTTDLSATFIMPNNEVTIEAEFELVPATLPPATLKPDDQPITYPISIITGPPAYTPANNIDNKNQTNTELFFLPAADAQSNNNRSNNSSLNKNNLNYAADIVSMNKGSTARSNNTYATSTDGQKVESTVKSYSKYVLITPKRITEGLANNFVADTKKNDKPIRYSLERISVEIDPKMVGKDKGEVKISLVQPITGMVFEKFSNIKNSIKQNTLWKIDLSNDAKATLRIKLDKQYKPGELKVYRFVPSKMKFLTVKKDYWKLVKIGSDYYVRIDNSSGGTYCVVK